jgi:hypothetical protein
VPTPSRQCRSKWTSAYSFSLKNAENEQRGLNGR